MRLILESGEPSMFTVLDADVGRLKWIAKIQFNGELGIVEERELLQTWIGAPVVNGKELKELTKGDGS